MIKVNRARDSQRSVPVPIRSPVDARLPMELVSLDEWPRNENGYRYADFYVLINKGLNSHDEALAANMGAVHPTVLPHQAEWFGKKVWDKVATGADVYVYQPMSTGKR